MAGVLEAKHIGRGVVEGVECEHLAFRNLDTDWQIWVEVGDRPGAAQIRHHQQGGRRRASVHAAAQGVEDRRQPGAGRFRVQAAGGFERRRDHSPQGHR